MQRGVPPCRSTFDIGAISPLSLFLVGEGGRPTPCTTEPVFLPFPLQGGNGGGWNNEMQGYPGYAPPQGGGGYAYPPQAPPYTLHLAPLTPNT